MVSLLFMFVGWSILFLLFSPLVNLVQFDSTRAFGGQEIIELLIINNCKKKKSFALNNSLPARKRAGSLLCNESIKPACLRPLELKLEN